MHVLRTDTSTGVARMTVVDGSDDHRFEVWASDGDAIVAYQETQQWRGSVEVQPPDHRVYQMLASSEPMQAFLDEYDCDSVKRQQPYSSGVGLTQSQPP